METITNMERLIDRANGYENLYVECGFCGYTFNTDRIILTMEDNRNDILCASCNHINKLGHLNKEEIRRNLKGE